jgi:hypothetical protein
MQCFICKSDKISQDADFTFEDYGEEGTGIIHEYHCMNCGARITYRISIDPDDIS